MTSQPTDTDRLRETVAAALAAHWWSATDDETCSCGWVAPMWAEACTGSDDEAEHAAVEVAHAAFLAHQTAAVLAALSVSSEAVWLRRKVLEYLDQHEHHDSWGVTCAYTSGLRDLLAAPAPSPTDEAAAADVSPGRAFDIFAAAAGASEPLNIVYEDDGAAAAVPSPSAPTGETREGRYRPCAGCDYVSRACEYARCPAVAAAAPVPAPATDGPPSAPTGAELCRHCGDPIRQTETGEWAHTVTGGSILYNCQHTVPYGQRAEPPSAPTGEGTDTP